MKFWIPAVAEQQLIPDCNFKIIGRSLRVHQEFLPDQVRRGRSLRHKCKLEVIDDAVHHGIVGDEGNDAHPCYSAHSHRS